MHLSTQESHYFIFSTYTHCATFVGCTCILALLANFGSEQSLQFPPVLLMPHHMEYKDGHTLWYGVQIEIYSM